MTSKHEKPSTAVQIRLLDVLDGDAARLEPIARCPRQERSVDARACVTCARMQSIAWDPTAGGEVVCTTTPERVPNISPRADLAEAAARRLLHQVVAPVTRCVTKNTPLARARALFADPSIACLPVIEGVMGLAGVITRADLFAAPAEGLVGELVLSRTVLPEQAPIGHAIALMATEGTNHVAVITGEGDLLGVWSSVEALRWIAKSMGYTIPTKPEPEPEPEPPAT